jgi:CheY-like chemotaxis protein
MVRILIVDDIEMERFRAAKLLEHRPDYDLLLAENGREALQVIEGTGEIDVVLADVFMPEMDGLTLLDRIIEKHSQIPVIVMTAKGNEELAVTALDRGASYYVPKRSLESSLLQAIKRVVTHVSNERRHRYLMSFLQMQSFEFQFDNDRNHIAGVTHYLQELLALQEAIVNAMVHGNLEISSDFREESSPDYERLIKERLAIPKFARRRVRLRGQFETHQIQFKVSDEGPGFDPAAVPDPTDPDNLMKCSGRGLLMMRHFMDEVVYNAEGNEVRLVKRCRMPSFEKTQLS